MRSILSGKQVKLAREKQARCVCLSQRVQPSEAKLRWRVRNRYVPKCCPTMRCEKRNRRLYVATIVISADPLSENAQFESQWEQRQTCLVYAECSRKCRDWIGAKKSVPTRLWRRNHKIAIEYKYKISGWIGVNSSCQASRFARVRVS